MSDREAKGGGEDLREYVQGDFLDSLDEELEMELDDARLGRLLGESGEFHSGAPLDRRAYFRELFRRSRAATPPAKGASSSGSRSA
jgi:hypothetical protein